jgi:CRP/FNR family cyclic AMP-dependent transcriptional regulator
MPSQRTALNVIHEDRDLADAIADERRPVAERLGRAPRLVVPAGSWSAAEHGEATRGGYGLLIIEGWLVRRVGLGRRVGAELLGPGDLLRPVDHDGEQATLPFEAGWRVLETLQLAVLNRTWSLRMAAVPEVGIELGSRALRRSARLASSLAISQHRHLDQAVLLMLWELADRSGRVRPDGVHVEVPLTHEILGQLVAARRPSVTTSLGRLREARLVEQEPRGYLLRGDPPAVNRDGVVT